MRLSIFLALRICVVLVAASACAAGDAAWPQFRGPAGLGVATSVGDPPVEFGPEKNVLWKLALPRGGSSPVIAGDFIFLTGFSDGKLETYCVDRREGSLRWRRAAKAVGIEKFIEKYATPADPSCATDGVRVVAYFGSCGLVCYDFEGAELWSVPMPVIASREGFGTGSSPIIHDGTVYLLRDEVGKASGLFAYDVKSGRKLWRASRSEFQAGFSTPVVWDGCLVTHNELRLKAYDLKTGAERWILRGTAAYPCSTPTVGADGNLYVSSWSSGSGNEPNPDFAELAAKYDTNKDGVLSPEELTGTPLRDFFSILDDNQNGLLESWEWDGLQSQMRTGRNLVMCVRPGGRGDITDTHVVWKGERGAAYVSSPLAYDGRLVITRDGGFATAYAMAGGRLLYEKQRLGVDGDYYASPVAARGRIYACARRGTVVVLKAADAFEVIARNALDEPISATPAIVGRAIYVRTDSHLWAFGAKDSP